MRTFSRCTSFFAAGIWLAVVPLSILAQNYPTKPVRWILGFPAGGTTDVLGRTIATRLSEIWGQQVIVDNRPGAGGIIANALAANAPPDGHTMLLISSTYANLIAMGKKLPYDPYRDLAPVTRLASVPNVLSVHPSLPVKSVTEFIALAKSRPGQIDYGSGGTLTGTHIAMELFKLKTGVDILHVPYKGNPAAATDLIAGRIQVMFALTPNAMPHLKSGKIRGIAVSGSSRIPDLPDLPTVAETVPGYEATVWYGLLMPAGTSPAIIDRLNHDVGRVLAAPDVIRRLRSVGFQVSTSTPQGLTSFMKSEANQWMKIIREANIPVN